MKKLVGVTFLAATLAVPMAASRAAAEEVTTEKQTTTTTSPSGRVVVESESSRTFKLQGQSQTYIAPPDVDLNTYTGKEVTVSVDSNGKVTKIERKTTTKY